jgi:hypothetical protein
MKSKREEYITKRLEGLAQSATSVFNNFQEAKKAMADALAEDAQHAICWKSASVALYQQVWAKVWWLAEAPNKDLETVQRQVKNCIESLKDEIVRSVPAASTCDWTRAYSNAGFPARRQALELLEFADRFLAKTEEDAKEVA